MIQLRFSAKIVIFILAAYRLEGNIIYANRKLL